MHPQSGTTKGVLILCMVILGILLLPLPFTAYKILKFFLSLFLLYTAGFFLRPYRNLEFAPSRHQLETGSLDPAEGTFIGTQIGGGKFEDISLPDVAYNTAIALFGSAFLTFMLMAFFESRANNGTPSTMPAARVPGELIITIFLLIYLSTVFRGFFTPVPEEERRYPKFHDRYDL